jgi:hypothetical protein
MSDQNWVSGFFEFYIVLAFGLAWWIMEWQGRRLDKRREEEQRVRDKGQPK